MMIAIEATDKGGSVALSENGSILNLIYEHGTTTHSERIHSTIDRVLSKHSVEYKSLDRIAVALGPGSFTAIRIAVTTAKTLAMVCNAKAVGVSTLRVMAEYGRGLSETIRVALDARRSEFYTQKFRSSKADLNAQSSRKLISKKRLHQTCHDEPDALLVYRERSQSLNVESFPTQTYFYPTESSKPLAAPLTDIAIRRFEHGKTAHPDELAPVYVRKSDAQKSRDNKLVS